MKNIFITLVLLVAMAGGVYAAKSYPKVDWTTDEIIIDDTNGKIKADDTNGKLKVANFTGKLEDVNVGCFVDGECFVVVDGKHISTILGWRQEVVGSVQGVEGFGDLEQHIGEEMEVYAQDKGDGTYTLYGSAGFYVKLLGKTI